MITPIKVGDRVVYHGKNSKTLEISEHVYTVKTVSGKKLTFEDDNVEGAVYNSEYYMTVEDAISYLRDGITLAHVKIDNLKDKLNWARFRFPHPPLNFPQLASPSK